MDKRYYLWYIKQTNTMNQLQETTARMLEIERINMVYNQTTTFGQLPNGQEDEIEALLAEWDTLKVRRLQLKHNGCREMDGND